MDIGQDKITYGQYWTGQYGHKKNEANYIRTKQIHRSTINTRALKTLEEQLTN